jgi:sodium/hydrogen exchanger-like protein 6/7
VEPKLFAIIFGESILNDSVAIVLFSTLGKFRGQELSIENVMNGIITFLGVFFGSTLIGVIIGLICAIMLKNSNLFKYPTIGISL